MGDFTGFDTWAISSRSTDKYLMFHEIFKLFLSEDNRVSHGLNYTGQPILAFNYYFSYIFKKKGDNLHRYRFSKHVKITGYFCGPAVLF